MSNAQLFGTSGGRRSISGDSASLNSHSHDEFEEDRVVYLEEDDGNAGGDRPLIRSSSYRSKPVEKQLKPESNAFSIPKLRPSASSSSSRHSSGEVKVEHTEHLVHSLHLSVLSFI